MAKSEESKPKRLTMNCSGGGYGHTAYYLAEEHGIKNIAVIEKDG